MPNGTVNWDKAVRLDRATEKVVGITAKLVNSHWLTCFPPGHQGIPAILLGFFTLFILPNQPESTRFFTEREREIASERGSSLGALKADTGAVVNKAHIVAPLAGWQIYTGGVIYTYALAQLLTVPPYAVAALVLCGAAYFTDRFQTRGLIIASACFLGAIGYLIVLVVPTNPHARYFAVFCITCGTYTAIGIVIAWFAHNLGSETKCATRIPMFMAIHGFGTTCVLNGLGGVPAVVLYLSYRWDNARRNAAYGPPDPDAPVDMSELADKTLGFRHIA